MAAKAANAAEKSFACFGHILKIIAHTERERQRERGGEKETHTSAFAYIKQPGQATHLVDPVWSFLRLLHVAGNTTDCLQQGQEQEEGQGGSYCCWACEIITFG